MAHRTHPLSLGGQDRFPPACPRHSTPLPVTRGPYGAIDATNNISRVRRFDTVGNYSFSLQIPTGYRGLRRTGFLIPVGLGYALTSEDVGAAATGCPGWHNRAFP